jgi:GNAT superfamily N-acetyltransferase
MAEDQQVEQVTIAYLADRPEFLEQIAWLSWKEWQEIYQRRDKTLKDCMTAYQERMNRDQLPLTLVALHDNELAGMVSLKFHDLDTRPDLDPWLGGVLVLPEWRNRGVATMLIHRATAEAHRLKIPRLYLWTPSAEGLYRKLGWEVIERTEYFEKPAVVMGRDIEDVAVIS